MACEQLDKNLSLNSSSIESILSPRLLVLLHYGSPQKLPVGERLSRWAQRGARLLPAATSAKMLETELGPGVERGRAEGLLLASRRRCPACSHAGSTASVWQGGQPGNGTDHQRRAWKPLTRLPSQTCTGTQSWASEFRLELSREQVGFAEFRRSRSGAARGARCLRQGRSGRALVRRADQLRKCSVRVT